MPSSLTAFTSFKPYLLLMYQVQQVHYEEVGLEEGEGSERALYAILEIGRQSLFVVFDVLDCAGAVWKQVWRIADSRVTALSDGR